MMSLDALRHSVREPLELRFSSFLALFPLLSTARTEMTYNWGGNRILSTHYLYYTFATAGQSTAEEEENGAKCWRNRSAKR